MALSLLISGTSVCCFQLYADTLGNLNRIRHMEDEF